MPVPEADQWEALPTANGPFRRPVASFVTHAQAWEIGWSGIWVKVYRCPLEDARAQANAAALIGA